MKKILHSNIARYISIFLAVIMATICIVSTIGTIQAVSIELYDNELDEAVENGWRNLLNLYSRQIFVAKDTNPEFMADSNMKYIIVKGLDAKEGIFEGENLKKLKDKNNYIYTNSKSIIDDLQSGADENDFAGVQTYYKHEEGTDWRYYDTNINLIRSLNNNGYQCTAQNVYTERTESVKSIYYDANKNAFYFETDSYKFPVETISIKIDDISKDVINILIYDELIYIDENGKYVDSIGNEIEFLKFNIEIWDDRITYTYYDSGYDNFNLDLSKYKDWSNFYINSFEITPEEISTVYKDLKYYKKDYTSYLNSDIKKDYVQNEAITIQYETKDGLEECFVVLSNVKYDLDKNADDLFIAQKNLITFLYNMRIAMLTIMFVSAVIFLILFAFSCCSRYICSVSDSSSEKIKKRIIHRIPLILYIMAMIWIIVVDLYMCGSLLREFLFYEMAANSSYIIMSLLLIFIIIAVYLAIVTCMEISCRAGAGILIKNTACYYVIIVSYRIFGRFKKFIKKCVNKIKEFCNYAGENISFTKKMIILLLLFDILSVMFVTFLIATGSYFILMLAGIILNILVVVVGFWLSMLQNQARLLANGDLSYKVDTSKMFWELKKHGNYLNQINGAISLAVKERMKSEHFKTELITNVSHDIKTPLTSIINYVDLLDRENISQPKAVEYIEVLKRQSARLKKLIEDLMEASKASTGNIDVHLESCNINILFTQMIGEYEEKLEAAGMETVVESGDNDIYIMADNRHIWRIFDNILNNICKYGQTGTRVYINLETISNIYNGGIEIDEENKNSDKKIEAWDNSANVEKVNIIFRNISKYRLNISKDELLERFVRGDGSRHTEGNGLGLSIAQNLAELMNGKLDIDVDGDLFKVILTFSVVR